MRTLMLVAVLVGLPMQAEAGLFVTGNDLVEEMRGYDKYKAGQPGVARDLASVYREASYTSYVIAAADAFIILGRICPPNHVTVGQVAAIVAAYLKANPKRWHEDAIYLVHDALKEAFPCG